MTVRFENVTCRNVEGSLLLTDEELLFQAKDKTKKKSAWAWQIVRDHHASELPTKPLTWILKFSVRGTIVDSIAFELSSQEEVKRLDQEATKHSEQTATTEMQLEEPRRNSIQKKVDQIPISSDSEDKPEAQTSAFDKRALPGGAMAKARAAFENRENISNDKNNGPHRMIRKGDTSSSIKPVPIKKELQGSMPKGSPRGHVQAMESAAVNNKTSQPGKLYVSPLFGGGDKSNEATYDNTHKEKDPRIEEDKKESHKRMEEGETQKPRKLSLPSVFNQPGGAPLYLPGVKNSEPIQLTKKRPSKKDENFTTETPPLEPQRNSIMESQSKLATGKLNVPSVFERSTSVSIVSHDQSITGKRQPTSERGKNQIDQPSITQTSPVSEKTNQDYRPGNRETQESAEKTTETENKILTRPHKLQIPSVFEKGDNTEKNVEVKKQKDAKNEDSQKENSQAGTLFSNLEKQAVVADSDETEAQKPVLSEQEVETGLRFILKNRAVAINNAGARDSEEEVVQERENTPDDVSFPVDKPHGISAASLDGSDEHEPQPEKEAGGKQVLGNQSLGDTSDDGSSASDNPHGIGAASFSDTEEHAPRPEKTPQDSKPIQVTSDVGNTWVQSRPSTQTVPVDGRIGDRKPRETSSSLDNSSSPRNAAKDNRKGIYLKVFLAALVVVIIVVVIVAIVRGRKGNEKKTASGTSTLTPSLSPTVSPIEIFPEVPVPNYTANAIVEDPLSPQFKAYTWLTEDPFLSSYPNWRRLQRLALATFYYSFDGDNWPADVKANWLEYGSSECDWGYTQGQEHTDMQQGSNSTRSNASAYMYSNISAAPNEDITFSGACNGEGKYIQLSFHEFDLQGETFPGTMPPEIALLTELERLGISANASMQELLPRQLEGLQNLTTLNLTDCHFQVWDSSVLPRLKRLETLDLSKNAFREGLPHIQLGEFTNLKLLNLSFSYATKPAGTIPSEIAILSHLEALYLSENRFSGPIPSEIGLMESLEYFYFDRNLISSSIPSELGMAQSLSELQMDWNLLTGTIPTEVGLLSSLTKFYARGYLLRGTLPSELADMTMLKALYLSGNDLSGPLPSELGLLPNLTELSLNLTSISGTIPTEYGDLTNLKQLYLSDTDLSGSVPEEICVLPIDTLAVDRTRVSCNCDRLCS